MADFTFKAKPSWQESKSERKAREERERAQRKEREQRRREEERRQEDHWRRTWERARSGHVYSTTRMSDEDKAMALEIINAGYRAMSRKHHPDFGGNHEAMVLVNRALEALRKMVG